MLISRKSLGPVLATGLFIVVAVVAKISFQVWFQDYSSQVFADVEKQSLNELELQDIVGTNIYIYSDRKTKIESLNIENENCNFYDKKLDEGLNRLDVSDCLPKSTGNVEILVESENEVFRKWLLGRYSRAVL